jgi:hypothetical protein
MAPQILTRRLSSGLRRAFFAFGFFGLIILGLLGTTQAQEANSLPSGVPQAQVGTDPFILGRQFPVNLYNPSEAVQWGFDFVISPSSAKDRVVLYAYDIQKTDAEFLRNLENLVFEKRPLIAIISSSVSTSSEAAKKGKDFAIPIVLDAQNKSFVSNFISILSDPSKSRRIVPAVIVVSALKSQGVDVDWERATSRRASLDQRWSGLIASSIPISGHSKPLVYIGLKSDWDVSKNPPYTAATQSELQQVIKLNFGDSELRP